MTWNKARSTVKVGTLPNGMQTIIPNAVVQGDGFYVSYNNYDIGAFGCATTAIVRGQMEHFLILSGDHREGLLSIRPFTYAGCVAYFREHEADKHKYSEGINDSA